MPTPEIHSLESINIRKAFPDEARNFTPWLTRNIDRLGDTIGIDFENVKQETVLQNAGRADIIARQADTGSVIVIENQLDSSDNDHCLRLIGYAAEIEASTLVWIAPHFSSYHIRILAWLNATDRIDIYAIVPKTYRINGSIGLRFRTVIQPIRPHEDEPRRRNTLATTCAQRYTSIVRRLRQEGIRKIGHGGYTGRYRSFHTDHENIVYSTAYDIPNGELRANLIFRGEQRTVFDSLIPRQDEIESNFGQALAWKNHKREHYVSLTRKGAPHADAPEEEIADAEEWMVTSILRFRDTFLPLISDLI